MDAHRFGCRVAGLVVLGALTVAAPASADWVEPVAAPVNPAQTGVEAAPAIADLGGTAYAALEEQTNAGDALVVVQQAGSSWQPVGEPLSTGNLTGPASITAAGGTLYVVWTQAPPGATGSSAGEVMADYLNSSGAWVPAGAPLNPSANDDVAQSSLSMASVNGTPYVAFADAASPTAPTQVVVEQYDTGSATWSEVGTPLLYSMGDTVSSTSLASVGGVPYVAWSEANLRTSQIDVASYSSGAWTSDQLEFSSDSYSGPALAAGALAGTLYLAYGDTDDTSGSDNAYVLQLSGGTWSSPIGGAVNDAGDELAFGLSPSIAEVGTTPYVALIESDSTGDQQAVVKQLDGGSWATVGTPLTNPQTDFPLDVSITSVGDDVPFVAWATEQCASSAGFALDGFIADFVPGATSNTAATSCPTLPEPPGPPTIPPETFPPAYLGVAYSITLGVSGGTPPYTWSATGLPPGLTLDPASGVVSGTPTALGTYTAMISITDADGFTVGGTLNLTINPAPAPTPVQNTTTSTSSTSTASAGRLASSTTVAPFGGITLTTASLTMAANGTVTATIGCPRTTPGGRCRGVGALYGATGSLPASVASVAKAKRAALLSKKSFSVAAGHSSGVRLALPKSVQREVVSRKHLVVKLVVTSADASGQQKTQTLTVTIRVAAKR